VDRGERDAGLVKEWLISLRAQVRREAAPWRPVDLGPALDIGRQVLSAHPDDEDLELAVKKLEALQ
jgi:hypothetical protein